MYGDYTLEASPVMNFSRLIEELERNIHPNFIAEYSYEEKFKNQNNLDYVKFHVDLGIVGYRIFFVNKQNRNRLNKVRILDDLKKFTIGQGRWFKH